MKVRKKNLDRPWLTSTGVEIATNELRDISKEWNLKTWELYLRWYEHGCYENLIAPATYDRICDELVDSVFDLFLINPSPEIRAECDRQLALLPELEAKVLRLFFLEGRTEVEIAAVFSRSQPGINKIKNRALLRLKRGNHGDKLLARQFMRGEDSATEMEEQSIWDEPTPFAIREDRTFLPENQKLEIDGFAWTSFKRAMRELPEMSQRILYLRYWCDFSHRQIARDLKTGVNVVQQIETAAVFKLKNKILALELGLNTGGDL